MFTDLSIDQGSDEFNPMLDVPFVPTDELVVEAMLELARVNEKDVLYDLGSGDGRIVVAAAMEREARAVGVDADPQRIEEAREFADWVGVNYLVNFIEDDFLSVDFSQATVVTLYLLPMINLELRPRILRELEPGTRIITHTFDMATWKADEKRSVGGVNIYKWVVPALVAGTWEWLTTDGKCYRVALTQAFQVLDGSASVNDQPAELVTAKLEGDRLQLTIRERGATSAETFVSRFRDYKLLPVADSRQMSVGIRVAVPKKPVI